MIPQHYPLAIDFPGTLYICPRPRGNDWLREELEGFKKMGVVALISLLTEDEQGRLESAMDTIRTAVAGGQTEAIRLETKALSEASDEFAARRMNREIRRALQGQSVDALSEE